MRAKVFHIKRSRRACRNGFPNNSEIYARIFAKKVLSIVEDIALFPKAGRVVPEYSDPNLRERIYGNYRIVYRLKDGVVEIAAICHGAQLLARIL
ncbi:MAG: type II toxin-antitoxin system RelE/ParE family toxin [Candidatus Marinimicrobia bacterium]|nr:type II toxin-antitoxin system RelE/ParE family toxin [Candidatus Neomarinimicrobiota bacterium]